MRNQSEELQKLEFLNKIREYLKKEKELDSYRNDWKGVLDVEDAQNKVHDWYINLGRQSMLEDILQWEQKLSSREAQLRRKKKTL